jgi:alpha-L-fucosidase
MKENVLYALLLAEPGGVALITSLTPDEFSEKKIKHITLLGMDVQLDWLQNNSALIVYLPENKPGEHAWVLKIETVA